MKRKITGFHLDEENDWVAELECHHGQHVRHKPPFINRPWVVSEMGRTSKLGNQLNCLKCDQGEPEDRYADLMRSFSVSFNGLGFDKQHLVRACGVRNPGDIGPDANCLHDCQSTATSIYAGNT